MITSQITGELNREGVESDGRKSSMRGNELGKSDLEKLVNQLYAYIVE